MESEQHVRTDVFLFFTKLNASGPFHIVVLSDDVLHAYKGTVHLARHLQSRLNNRSRFDATLCYLLLHFWSARTEAMFKRKHLCSRQRFVNVSCHCVMLMLQAEKLILMTDVPGVLRDKHDVSTKFAELSIRQTTELVEEGVIAGGMIPKVQCCRRAISQGVSATHIIDGRQQHSLLLELLTEAGVGTMITG
jgi:Amino acid kinase family